MNFDLVFGKLSVLVLVLCSVLVGAADLNPASQWSSDELRNHTLRRHRTCLENQQYLHQGLCCLNCQAGTFVQNACERDLEPGTCQACEHGRTYTEHSNGMNRCLPCTHCRMDEMETVSCSTTSDTQCQCRQGTFCVPEQACEVCKRCAKCKAGEAEVKKCTPFSNTLCRKREASPTQNAPASAGPTPPPRPPPSAPEALVIPLILLVLSIPVVGFSVWWFFIKRRSCERPCAGGRCDSSEIVKIPIEDGGGATAEERQNDQNAGLEGEESRPESRPLLQETQAGLSKASPPLEDEDRGLGDSLPNTTSSSQTSLSALPTASSPHHSPVTERLQPAGVDHPLQSRLVPLLGSEKSLRKSFDLFDEHLDVQIHNKFFRMIGVSDNHIRLAESAPQRDKVYDLLKNWMQKQGLKADINSLLDALLGLDQRRSAESIAMEALRRRYYKHADAP